VDGGSFDPDVGDTITLSINTDTFTCADLGSNTVILTVSDGQLQNTCQAVVTVEDDLPPNTAIISAVDGNTNLVANGGTTLSTDITFTFSGMDNCEVTTFECSLYNF